MPRRDGTGPMGTGAMTGKRAGMCNGNFVWDFGGYGCQKRHGRQATQADLPGYLRNSNTQNIQPADEKTMLETQETRMENQLKLVKERITELNNSTSN